MSVSQRITVLVADDHPMFRASVVRAIKHHSVLSVVGEAADGQDALAQIRKLTPALALIDLRMPGLDGIAVLNAVQRDQLTTRVVLLSGALDDEQAYRALEAGAAALLPKSLDAPSVIDGLLAVARGETVVAGELQRGIAEQIRLRAGQDRPVLTSREQTILELIAQGRSGPQIAGELIISPSTVKTHTEKLYEKLGVSDRAAAVARGMRLGLIE